MNHGFVRVCAATPKIQVADPEFNGNEILKLMEEGRDHHAFLMVFPELFWSSRSCAFPDIPVTICSGMRRCLRRRKKP